MPLPTPRLLLGLAAPCLLAGGFWWGLEPGAGGGVEPPAAARPKAQRPEAQRPAAHEPTGEAAGAAQRREALARARLQDDIDSISAFLDEQRALVAQDPAPEQQRVLAAALLERSLARDRHRGFRVGSLVPEESFAANRDDLEEGLALVRAARAAGDEDSENYRLEASFLSCQLINLGRVLAHRGSIKAALEKALERDPDNGHAHVALGCRLLLVPSWLGQDLAGAIQHFNKAEQVMPADERPLLMLAFAHHLAGDPEQCRAALRRAEQRNPDNRFVRVVLRRLAKGDAGAFERDV